MKKFFYFVIVVLFVGCSLKQEPMEINSYSIDFNLKNYNHKNVSKTILIEEPVVNKTFNSKGIFYSTKPYLFEEYAKNRWINIPSSMIYNSLLDSFQNSNIHPSKNQYDYVLKTDVLKLYHEIRDDKSYMILRVNFELLKENKILKSFDFDKRIEISQNKPYEFVKVVNKTFEQIVEELFKDINNSYL